MAPLSNDTADLDPRTEFDGRVLRFDFPGLEVGVAEYDEGPTGCTIFHFPGGAACETDVRGGSSGTLGGAEWVRAICFAGGSLYGLEAGAGVAAELLARSGYEVGWTSVWPVSAAIIFDFRRESTIYPDKELGRAALRAARPGVFPLGARGAGRSATVGKTFALERGEPAGQGGAFRAVGPTRIAVFVVVNAFGAIVDRDGMVVRGHLDTEGGGRLPLVPEIERRIAAGETPGYRAPESTTLTLVVTNQRLERRPLRQLGRQVHASLARAIQPFHSLVDGDVLYVATTNEVGNPALDSVSLGVVASELAWDAVLACFDTD